jgi:uncharacterized membrane protein
MIPQPLLVFVHLASVVLWVGGMVFAYAFLRPAAVEVLEPPVRLRLWVAVFRRFFPWVNAAIGLILASGLTRFAEVGGPANAPVHWHVMMTTGLLMMAIYLWVRLGPWKALNRAVLAQDWKAGGAALAAIRRLVGTNVVLGLVTIGFATLGRMFF